MSVLKKHKKIEAPSGAVEHFDRLDQLEKIRLFPKKVSKGKKVLSEINWTEFNQLSSDKVKGKNLPQVNI